MVGKSYEATVRLSSAAIAHWDFIDGQKSGQGVNILALPFSRFLSVINVWMMEHLEEDDRDKWERKLDDPLPGRRDRSKAGFDDISQLNNL